MSLRILNDSHIGANRTGGTTLMTRWYLKTHILNKFKRLLPVEQGIDLMILGDLFDAHDVASVDVFNTFTLLNNWLVEHPAATLYLVAGNHDLSKTSTTFSSFELLAGVLLTAYPDRVLVIREPTIIPYGYVIPHLPDQEAFNAALAGVPQCDILFLHVNYDNKFAAQSDQSLNISKEQVAALPVNRIISGHEHQYKLANKIILPGNQIATSVSDWVSNGTNKVYLQLSNHQDQPTTIQEVPCASKDEEYIEVDWRNLSPDIDQMFVRVVGDAEATEAAQAVSAIAAFRQVSPAYVITNAVNIALGAATGDFQTSLEQTRGFDVMTALRAYLTPEQFATVEGLHNANQPNTN